MVLSANQCCGSTDGSLMPSSKVEGWKTYERKIERCYLSVNVQMRMKEWLQSDPS